MFTKVNCLIAAVSLVVGAQVLQTGQACDSEFASQYRESARIVDSLRVDKPGLMRVFAVDGSEFTAGQALWLKGQLRLADDAYVRGNQAEAARHLAAVRGLLDVHRTGS